MYQAYVRNRQKEFVPGKIGTLDEVKLYARREVGNLGLRCLFDWDTNFDDAGQLSYRCGNDDKHVWAYVKYVDAVVMDVTIDPIRDDFRELMRSKTVWDQDRFKDKREPLNNDEFKTWLHEHHNKPYSKRLG